jgi:glutathione S-transferase
MAAGIKLNWTMFFFVSLAAPLPGPPSRPHVRRRFSPATGVDLSVFSRHLSKMPNADAYPKIILHAIAPYDRSAMARWLLAELGVPCIDRWVDPKTNEFASPGFLLLNPMGRVPVAEIDGAVMFESGAICATLADRFSLGSLAPALESPHRPEYEKWMYFAAATVDQIQPRMMVLEDFPASETKTEKLDALFEDLGDICTTLDRTLTNSGYLVANQFSAADICVSYHLEWFKLWPELAAITQAWPRVGAYAERLKARPSAISAKVFTYRA